MRLVAALFALSIAASAAAQQAVTEADDFVDPRDGGRPVFIARIAAGGAWNFVDAFRPGGNDVGFVSVANSFYWQRIQLDYDHSEMRAKDDEPDEVLVCGCDEQVRFPNRRPGSPPPPSSKDTLQVSLYWPIGGKGGIPVMLRSSVRVSRQPVNGIERSLVTGQVVARLSGDERTFTVDTDTWFPIGGHDVFGSLAYTTIETRDTIDDRRQTVVSYTNRFPAWSIDKAHVLIRPTLTVGRATSGGIASTNIVSPAVEAFWHHARSRANFHVVLNPQWREGEGGWTSTNQIAFFIDRALFVKIF